MPLLTIPAAASSLGVSRRTLDREIAAGMLQVIRIRGARRVAEDDLQQYIADRRGVVRWLSTSAESAGITVSKSPGGSIRDRLDEALRNLRQSESRRSDAPKSRQRLRSQSPSGR